MYKKVYFYLVILLVISIGFAIPGCGGGNNGTLPVTNTNASIDSTPSVVTSTPTPLLTNVSVSGYIYCNNITTEDGETVPNINVLDVSACQTDSSGNEPFVSQVANTIKSDYPEDWKKPEIQELYAQLNKTLSESKPLSEINGQVYSAYADSQSATPIPVSSDGHFDNTVLTGVADSTVKLEVALGEDNYTEVETLPSSDTINSSDATSAVLKSCPEKIFAFPGEIVIFKVQAEPGINLKSAGLRFTLNNPSIGCITQPVYLCIFGAHKYQISYGCVYIKHGLATPVDTTITAKTNNGLKVEIPVEIVKSTLSISGRVYVSNGATLVKGYVKAYGPKGFCKLDASGNYTLPRVFKSHGVTVKATWWAIEGGKTVRHREERVMDFLNGDVTDLNFGVLPLTDQYYDYISLTILDQKTAWEEELGKEAGTQKTADWINGRLPGNPPPSNISDAIKDAEVDEYEPETLNLLFKSGLQVGLDSNDDYLNEDTSTSNRKISSSVGNKDSKSKSIIASDALTVKNEDILMLGPASLEDYKHNEEMFITLRQEFENRYGKSHVTCLHTRGKLEYEDTSIFSTWFQGNVTCTIKDGEEHNVPRPIDFLDMDKYGIIYFYGHASRNGIMACPYYENDALIHAFMDTVKTAYYKYIWKPFALNPKTRERRFYKQIFLLEDFFANDCSYYDFRGSILFFNGCESFLFHTGHNTKINYKFAPDAQVFLGYPRGESPLDVQEYSYTFFIDMLNNRANVADAYTHLTSNIFTDTDLLIDTGIAGQNNNTYLPGDVSVTIQKNNPKGKVWQNGNK
jgi:hypothetical protein